ncbi:DUF424 domain-containing protein [Candidatus Micrarchaeota archaeon CG_4_10_14_0_2_um_filter_60_11]|nr:MAG: hypothetical protein AUJ16_01545 [Candidatus Micrarchaeota archaeon CG1_02_60_51]PIN96621.1 MAG: DUF424 domain-containing protein [Candidatus Micrarchaeota archaeon CG10_big_fil_rev_8_21_14_0_10_60_32]PIO01644.1 MAG: DUF424 domain-containing protein [Candidatus Micrarchaeota archaeon CG09_land_8_20_14_0_10_60_16]PIY91690.1 MAG: DUF424 domain-containing protein [Candidatus Micrarchaeota archaeon CG_4_10_14_0_8_um_filter_60_7]PIZ90545.1 MAG: DUF424 domain-containing protein [Candidatus Mi
MFCRVHERFEADGSVTRVAAVCDAKLLGKKFESGGRVLDLKVHRSFYEGKRASAKEVLELLGGCKSANLVGEKAVACGKKAFGRAPSYKIKGVPVLLVFKA